MFNKSVEFVKKCVQVMVYWVNITSNDERIFTYVHLRKAPCNEMQKATARSVHKSCLRMIWMERIQNHGALLHQNSIK